MRNHAIVIMKPMSPIRLYKTACRAAVLASARPCHHPISRNDIIPTPSQPMKSWNMLLAVTKMIIVIRNKRRYLKNRLMWGSECMYHSENSIMAQVTNNAIGTKISEKKSSLKLRDSFTVCAVIQCQFEMNISCPDCRKIVAGIMLVKNAYEMEVVT